MQSGDLTLAILADDFRFDDERHPIIARGPPSLESEHREATWETRNTTEYGLEGFGKMMGDEVLEHLDSCNPRLTLVGYSSLAADTHDHLVMVHTIDKILQRIRENLGICVDLKE